MPRAAQIARARRGLSLRQGRHADPLRAENAAALEESGARQRGAAAPDARPRRRVEGGERMRARHAAGGADDLRRPAACARSLALSRGRRHPLAAAPRGAAHHQGRRRRHDRTSARRRVDRSACARPMPTGSRRSLQSHIDGFAENVVARRAYSPSDLEALNINLVGGDPYGGACSIDQFFIWRPFADSVNHKTPITGPLPDRRLDASRRRGCAAAPASRSPSGWHEGGAMLKTDTLAASRAAQAEAAERRSDPGRDRARPFRALSDQPDLGALERRPAGAAARSTGSPRCRCGCSRSCRSCRARR